MTEACGNAVRHAYPESDGEVCVSYVVAEDSIVMIVEDQGAGIAPDESLEPTPAPLEGGMGMSIIRAIVDELDVRDRRRRSRNRRSHDEAPERRLSYA